MNSAHPQRVVAYVDGFNLYHGLHAANGRRDLWLDIEAMLREPAFTDPSRGQHLVAVHYFTAAVDGPGRDRQDVYLRALAAHGTCTTTHLGRFQCKLVTCRHCGVTWNSWEEKESDVSLAVELVKGAALDHYDRALLLSADSDMCPAVRSARAIAPHKPIIAVFPPRRHSDQLRQECHAVITLTPGRAARNQLPAAVTTPTGSTLRRPAYWT
ncbi:MAG: NYN domain-containing protein [Kineosporiaceae bacterium]|nr:NYN domain-containing protein [Kineosporiaceae bacterium]